jgi:hypothetical protein
MDISAIGGGMQGFGAMQGIQGMQQDFQAVQGPQDMKEMKGLENEKKQPKPEEMQAQGINQQDKTEMSDEAQEVNGAQAAAEAGKVGGVQAQQQDQSQQIKDAVQKIIDEAKVQGPGKQGQNQGTNGQVEQLKQQLTKAQQNGTPIDASVKEAADRVVQGDIKGADQILNGQQQQKDQVGAAQGLAEEQQVGKAKETHADKIIAGIQGMGQVPQQ